MIEYPSTRTKQVSFSSAGCCVSWFSRSNRRASWANVGEYLLRVLGYYRDVLSSAEPAMLSSKSKKGIEGFDTHTSHRDQLCTCAGMRIRLILFDLAYTTYESYGCADRFRFHPPCSKRTPAPDEKALTVLARWNCPNPVPCVFAGNPSSGHLSIIPYTVIV